LAVLCGLPPETFEERIPEATAPLPAIAPNLPSNLLERRPDVAAAERALAARNASIGVAQAAFFPVVRLTAAGGYLSGDVDDLFLWDSRTWSIGPSVSLPLFAGGRNRANLERARMAYEEGVAIYRQQILQAFRDVEDSLAAIRFLDDQVAALQEAARAGRRSAQISYARYTAGAINFIEVVDSETVRLQAELAAIQGATEQRLALVRLIKAVGGGWDEQS
jgi:multidrug efflux system outer membrane protein